MDAQTQPQDRKLDVSIPKDALEIVDLLTAEANLGPRKNAMLFMQALQTLYKAITPEVKADG